MLNRFLQLPYKALVESAVKHFPVIGMRQIDQGFGALL